MMDGIVIDIYKMSQFRLFPPQLRLGLEVGPFAPLWLGIVQCL